MTAKYDMSDLKNIGMHCKNRLPPANAVQAMFLYEMQREADVQALFECQMFELARVEDATKSHEPRLEELEEQMKDVQKKANSKDIDERLATTKVRTDALAARLNEHFIRLGEYGRRLTDVEAGHTTIKETKEQETIKLDTFAEEIKNVKSALEAAQTATKQEQQSETAKVVSLVDSLTENVKTVKSELEPPHTATKQEQQKKNEKSVSSLLDAMTKEIKTIEASLESADKEIGLLFEERDGLYDRVIECEGQISELKKSNERIEKLEGLVRALTAQISSSPSSAGGSRSPSVHFCPLTTKGPENVDLVVQKGKGFVSMGKEDIKPFVPGRSWGS